MGTDAVLKLRADARLHERLPTRSDGSATVGCRGGGADVSYPYPWRQRLQLAGLTLPPPVRQVGAVEALTPQQGTKLAGLGTGIRLTQDVQLVGRRERPATGAVQHLGVGHRTQLRGVLVGLRHGGSPGRPRQ
jgi:hypothetical protein